MGRPVSSLARPNELPAAPPCGGSWNGTFCRTQTDNGNVGSRALRRADMSVRRFNSVPLAALLGLVLSAAMANAAPVAPYFQTNLVSDISGLAPVTDPNLMNPWGVSESATSPLWISNQAASTATLYTVNELT